MNAIVPVVKPIPEFNDGGNRLWVTLAREIAMDIHPIEDILKRSCVSPEEWEKIRQNSRFTELLRGQVEEWEGATNTVERVKLKTMVAIEEVLPEFYGRMHDPAENLPAKAKVLEIFSNIAGLSKNNQAVASSGEKFSVTINLGADQQLKISAPSPQIVDASDK